MNKYRIWCPNKKQFIVLGMTAEELMMDASQSLELLFSLHDECVWQRSMGVQDMDGKDIYEGDIVSVIEPQHLFVVKFGKVKRTVQLHESVQYYSEVDIHGFYFHHLLSGNACFSIPNNKFGEHDLKRTKIEGDIFNGR